MGGKPDRSIEFVQGGNHIRLVELKTEKAAIGRPNLVKLGTMLKDCLDGILPKGFKRSSCFTVDLLQEGRSTTVYLMYSPSNYFYVMCKVYGCSFGKYHLLFYL
jgi:hypothetical protein